jgi:hypothetical protein
VVLEVVYVDYHLDDPHVRSVSLVVHPLLSASIHKAGEYLTLLLERDPLITYPEIIEKLEKRFGFQDVPKMSMIQFQNCKQEKHESLVPK